MTEELFDASLIRASFDAIATRLEEIDAPAGLLIVVGGSFMALHGLRDSTHDIDTVNRISRRSALRPRRSRAPEASSPIG